MTQEEITNLKHVEFYAASVNAWFNTKLEHDKSLLTLSAGGVGLLLTLLPSIESSTALIFFIGAISSFVVTLVALLFVFRRNGTHIENVISENDATDPVLKRIDILALWAFGIGVVFTATIGITAAINSYSSKDKTMATDTTKKTEATQTINVVVGKFNLDLQSFDGMAKLQQQLQPPQLAARSASPAVSTPAPAVSNASQTQSGNTK
jgi:hypothetical protein